METREGLALGCGDKFHGESWVHLDISDLGHVDVIHDLQEGTLPFDNNSFEKVRAVHVLEHLSQEAMISILKEISRVTVPGGEVYIVLPHFLSWNASDLDHFRAGSRKTFVQFTAQYGMNTPYPTLFSQEKVEYDFHSHRVYRWARRFLSDSTVAQFFPNAVNEIQYTFENIGRVSEKQDSLECEYGPGEADYLHRKIHRLEKRVEELE